MVEMKYEKMLDRLYLSLPEQTKTKERFEMPKVESHIQGQKTIIKNASAILKAIHREEKHLVKFITKDLGVPTAFSEGRIVITGKLGEKQITNTIENYIKNYVLCRECSKPDTKFIEMQGIKMMKCEACGALTSIKPL
ncbi:translation initiation factor IF-2 subunit beta [Candidatus Micrarchaeota archaeon]|nr:translation initiation factor IF-2 subunit beta [Candidatus Micrarchaeota archaeon]MBU2476370.1 translation initiation factor IF-2 subunit beta [Candidatus Micrarchaeota archaeon]